MRYCKTREDKLRLVSAVFQSEGCFNYSGLRPNFQITSSSKKASENLCELLKELEYKPYMRYDGAFRVSIHSLESSIKLCYDILPYFNHTGKVQDILFGKYGNSGIAQLGCLNRIRIKNEDTKVLFEKIKNVLNIGSMKLFEYLGENFNISKGSAQGWVYGKRGIPISVIEELCEIANENILNFVPPYISFLLLVHNHINYNTFKETRGMDCILVREKLSHAR